MPSDKKPPSRKAGAVRRSAATRTDSAALAPHIDRDIDGLNAAELAEAIRFHNWRYFIDDDPVIPDAVYDRLVRRLQLVDAGAPILAQVGAAADVDEDQGAAGDKVDHTALMLSLDKCYDAAGLTQWEKGLGGTLVASPKVDGLACSIRYDARGRFLVAATRGDGRRGENISQNARRIPSIPTSIDVDRLGSAAAIEVRGEVYLPLSAFARVADRFSNPRNTAAGAMKSKESPGIPLEDLAFFAYDLLGCDVSTEQEKARLLADIGFTPVETEPCTVDAAQAVCDRIAAARGSFDYELDGVVFKIDDVATQVRLGATAHHPRWAIAYKFQGDSDVSAVEEVEWSLSRTGTITPVAIVEPVQLSGASVTRATLHNLSNFLRLGLHRGDLLRLTRRGGVIPHVEANHGGGDDAFAAPAICPSCGGAAVAVDGTPRKVDGRTETTTVLRCAAPDDCPAVQRGRLTHFTRALEMDGFGEKVVDALLEHHLVRDPADLFHLRPADLLPLPRMGPALAEKLVAEIQRQRRVESEVFVRALGVDGLGHHAASLLTARWSVGDLRSRTVEEIAELHSLGDLSARSIVEGLADQASLIDRLLAEIELVAPADDAPTDASPRLHGEVVVFTGTLTRMSRRDAQQLVSRHGARSGGSITAETTVLVVGGDELESARPSTKLTKARKLEETTGRPRIASEAEFFDALGLEG